MQHQHVALRHDQTVLIFTLGRDALNQAEEPVAPRWYMGAMLNVVGRPELLCCNEILLIEQGVERFEDKGLVSLGCKFAHFGSPWFCRQRFSLSAGLLLRLRSDGGSRVAVLCERDDDGRSIRGQTFGDCSTNAARTAGNECNLFPSSFLDIVFFLFLNLALLQIQPRMWAMPFGLAVFGVEDPRLGGRNRNVD